MELHPVIVRVIWLQCWIGFPIDAANRLHNAAAQMPTRPWRRTGHISPREEEDFGRKRT